MPITVASYRDVLAEPLQLAFGVNVTSVSFCKLSCAFFHLQRAHVLPEPSWFQTKFFPFSPPLILWWPLLFVIASGKLCFLLALASEVGELHALALCRGFCLFDPCGRFVCLVLVVDLFVCNWRASGGCGFLVGLAGDASHAVSGGGFMLLPVGHWFFVS